MFGAVFDPYRPSNIFFLMVPLQTASKNPEVEPAGIIRIPTGPFPIQIVGVQLNELGSNRGPKRPIFGLDSGRLAV
jgi:hypothetical protein